jgi:hypothetical protein
MQRRPRFFLVGFLTILGLACSCLGLSPGLGAPQVEFPLTPDPLTIQVTLDKSRAASSIATDGVAMGGFVQTTGAGGSSFEVTLPEMMVAVSADGSVTSAAGKQVTITPIKSVEGLPFSGGLLAGLQLTPSGLEMVGPAAVSITLPGNYDPKELKVFVANDSGAEFHLQPATLILPPVGGEVQPSEVVPPALQTLMPPAAASMGNGTVVMFDMMHFSMAGVVRVTTQEVAAQEKHPPSDSLDQANQKLADDLLEEAEKDVILFKSYNNVLRPRILDADCVTGADTAGRFLSWYSLVKTDKKEQYFQQQIKEAVSKLQDALLKCLKDLCTACLNQKKRPNFPQDMAANFKYYDELGKIAGNASSPIWIQLVNKCAVKQGQPEILPAVAQGEGSASGPTPVVSCP